MRILHVHWHVLFSSLLPVTRPNDVARRSGVSESINTPQLWHHHDKAPTGQKLQSILNLHLRWMLTWLIRGSEMVAVEHVLHTPQRKDTSSLQDRTWGVRATAQTLRMLFQCLIGWIVTGLSLHSRELITSMPHSLAFASVPWQAECHLHPLDWPLCKLINSWSNYGCFCTLCNTSAAATDWLCECV